MQTLQLIEIELFIEIHRKRGLGWLTALDELIFTKPTKPKKPTDAEPCYDYDI